MGQFSPNPAIVNQVHELYERKYRQGGTDPYGQPYPRSARITKTEIKQVLTCRANEDYSPLFSTDLYQKRSGAYTRLLCVIATCVG